MKIGLSYIIREDMIGKVRYLSEFDSKEDINRLIKAICNAGHEVVELGFGELFIKKIINEKLDVVFNYAEGFSGSSRESQIPSILEMLQIPIIGSNAYCLTLTQNKHLCNLVCNMKGISTPNGVWVEPDDFDESIVNDLNYPLLIKPSREGSSYGVDSDSVVNGIGNLRKKVQNVFDIFDQPVLIEEFISGREICAGIIGNETPTVFPLIETIIDNNEKGNRFLTYDMKREKKEYKHERGNLDTTTKNMIIKIALFAYGELKCTDYARIDFRLSKSGIPYIIDINPTPSLKEHSSFPTSSYFADYTYDSLVEEIINVSMIRQSL